MRPAKTMDMYPSTCVVEVHTLYHMLNQPSIKDHTTRDLSGTNQVSDPDMCVWPLVVTLSTLPLDLAGFS